MRRTILVMATMLFAVLGIGGVAYAAVIQYEADVLDCLGTNDPDNITGTQGPDRIRAPKGTGGATPPAPGQLSPPL